MSRFQLAQEIFQKFVTKRNIIIIVITYITANAGSRIFKYYLARSKVRRKGHECQLACQKLAEHLENEGISKEKRDSILKLTIHELQEKLRKGDLQSVDVCQAYQSAALSVDRQLNCVVEPIWEAEELAIERDHHRKEKGLLHGIPISIKENYYIQGYDCTAGMEYYIGKPANENAVILQVIKKQGGVAFVRTNIPQTMMTFECSNPIFGKTKNPHDHKRGPGGSSGGEAALIAGGGSILGFGTDIGGSIRIPANMCGICGLKPTYGRLSTKGTHNIGKGQTLICSTTGPLACDVDGVVLAMRAVLCKYMFDLDPTIPPIPFREEMFTNTYPLRIGYYMDDGYIQSVPSMHRAVDMVKKVLQDKGHKLVPFKPVDPQKMFTLYLRTVGADGCDRYTTTMRNDIYDPTVRTFFYVSKWPNILKRALAYVASKIGKDEIIGKAISAFGGLGSVFEYQRLAEDIEELKAENLKLWTSAKLDAVICPGFAFPAIHHYTAKEVLGGAAYTTMYNVLNYPAGTVPVTKVTQEDVKNMEHYPVNTMFEKNVKKMMLNGTVGLPCGVQCVSLPYKEELVLRIMKEAETGLLNQQSEHK